MKRWLEYRWMRLLWVFAFVFLLSTAGAVIGAPDGIQDRETVKPPFRAGLRYDPNATNLQIPQQHRQSRQSIQMATIHVNYLPAGSTDTFNNPCNDWTTEAISAFEHAVDIWAGIINSSVPIEINACHATLDPNILSMSAPDYFYRNFPNAPQTATWYPTALANALHGARMNGSVVDMHITYNGALSWYYGADGNTPAMQLDFVSLALHEICHGLGFFGSMTVENEGNGNIGYWGWGISEPGYQDPLIYDRFAKTGAGVPLLSLGNGTTILGSALTSDDVYFTGAYAIAANGNVAPELYAPSVWRPDLSYLHLAESYNTANGGQDALMTYALGPGESFHSPGPVTLGILKDIGWTLTGDNTPPTLAGIPDIAVPMNQSSDNVVDLWEYAHDAEDEDSELTFSFLTPPTNTLGLQIDSNRYIDVNPATNLAGDFLIEVLVQDSNALTDTDIFVLTITEENIAPTLSVPDIALGVNTNTTLDLWTYAEDGNDADATLVFTIEEVSTTDLAVSLTGGHLLNIAPALDWVGAATVTVNVRDPEGLTASDAFAVYVTAENITPTLAIPDIRISFNGHTSLNLWDYANDDDDVLTFTLESVSTPNLTVTLDSGHLLSITPAISWTGAGMITVKVSDPESLSALDSFTVTVEAMKFLYLPLVLRIWPPLPGIPTLLPIANADYDGAYTVEWTTADRADAYELQEDDNAAFSNPTQVYSGTATSWATSGKSNKLYYRVRGHNALGEGFWSNTQSVQVIPTLFKATADTYIAQGKPNINYGEEYMMRAGYDSVLMPQEHIVRSLVRFDLSEVPPDATIASAALRLYYMQSSGEKNEIHNIAVYRVTSPWSEYETIWNSAPNIGETHGSIALRTAESWYYKYYSIDVTNLVRGWTNGTLPNYGIQLRGSENASWQSFATRENATREPLLQITYGEAVR